MVADDKSVIAAGRKSLSFFGRADRGASADLAEAAKRAATGKKSAKERLAFLHKIITF